MQNSIIQIIPEISSLNILKNQLSNIFLEE